MTPPRRKNYCQANLEDIAQTRAHRSGQRLEQAASNNLNPLKRLVLRIEYGLWRMFKSLLKFQTLLRR